MPGSENNVQYSGGYRLEASSAEAIFLMQRTASDVSCINYDGTPEGAVSANLASICYDRTNGNLYYKKTGTGTTGWLQIASTAASLVSVTTDSGIAVPALGNLNLITTATNGIDTSASGSTITVAMATPYADGDFEFRSAVSGATRVLSVTNTSNTASSQAQMTHSVAGTTAGDVWSQYTVGTTRTYAEGIDNSDSQKLKLTTAASATANPSTATPIWSFTPATGFNYDNSGTSGYGIGFGQDPSTNYSVALQKSLDGFYGLSIYNSSAGTSALGGIALSNNTPTTVSLSVPSSTFAAATVTRDKLFINAGSALGIAYAVSPTGTHDFYSNAAAGTLIMSAAATTGLTMSTPINIGTNQIFSSRGTAASVGAIGQVLTASATGVSLTSGSANNNITSLVLTAGIWSVTGSASCTATTSTLALTVGINATTNTFTTICVDYNQIAGFAALTTPVSLQTPTQIIAVASNTTYYLNLFPTFTGTGTGTGRIVALRVA